MNAPDYDSEDDVCNGVQHVFNQKRETCKRKIYDELKQAAQDIQDLDRRNASAKRGKQGKLFSKLECMQEYHAALKTLLDRFDHATNEQEGKDDFRYDIKQIEHDMKVVFAAGWESVKSIMAFGGFPRITGINDESDQPDASCSMLSMLGPRYSSYHAFWSQNTALLGFLLAHVHNPAARVYNRARAAYIFNCARRRSRRISSWIRKHRAI